MADATNRERRAAPGIRELRRRQRWLRASIGRQLAELRAEQGLPRTAVASAAGIDAAHLFRIEAGTAQASLEAIVAAADALGADVSLRLFESRPAKVQDRFQAAIVEALVRLLDRRWSAELEVVVAQPSRGVVDLVIVARDGTLAIVVEVHSELRSLERTLRKLAEKVEGIISLGRFGANVSRLLVVRSTTDTRAVARAYVASLGAALPGVPRDAFAALSSRAGEWPGPSLLWADVSGSRARILDRPPRSARDISAGVRS